MLRIVGDGAKGVLRGGGLCGGEADWGGLVLDGVARAPPRPRHRSRHQRDCYVSIESQIAGELEVGDFHS